MSTCPKCGHESDGGFCSECGTNMAEAKPKFCANCGIELKPNSKFCAGCGTAIGEAPSIAPSAAAPTATADPVRSNEYIFGKVGKSWTDNADLSDADPKELSLIHYDVIDVPNGNVVLELREHVPVTGKKLSDGFLSVVARSESMWTVKMQLPDGATHALIKAKGVRGSYGSNLPESGSFEIYSRDNSVIGQYGDFKFTTPSGSSGFIVKNDSFLEKDKAEDEKEESKGSGSMWGKLKSTTFTLSGGEALKKIGEKVISGSGQGDSQGLDHHGATREEFNYSFRNRSNVIGSMKITAYDEMAPLVGINVDAIGQCKVSFYLKVDSNEISSEEKLGLIAVVYHISKMHTFTTDSE